MPERTTLSSWVQGIVLALELEGLDGRQLFAELGLDYQALQDPDARFPQDAMSRLWQRAVALSGNPAIALNIARVRRPAFHVVGYALMSSRNLAEGFARLERYQRIIAEASDLTFRRTPQGYRLGVTVHGDRLPAPPQSAECSLAYLVDMVRWITGRPLDPLAVELPGAPREPLAPYAELFRAPLRFHAEEFALVFSRVDLETPLPSANEALAQLHDRFAGEYLARFSTSRITHLTRQTLCRLLPQGEPKRERVAQALHLSQRTLQRRLQEEGTSYQQLLDDTRRDMAEQYLQQPGLTLLEVAYLLGFADPSNFFRAFRRWFGCTPNEYRARRQERPG
ncbi:AraC family transcriptional regulator [Pseudomonas aeruginosa]|uniref:AraC family transcriptional regulator n=1 Tax=Pseudomonas aeruginosa TaxID=287 RepID=UPI0030054E02|nr:AraC family transcriptional regulator [Pseudomonas aeruginosa]MCS9864765.1 AraC family transcriptional regulator [Pseudomonas aeruginosa]HCR1369320.1 AraC family transcriptional regulator [Pseudomonas aeruginosa]